MNNFWILLNHFKLLVRMGRTYFAQAMASQSLDCGVVVLTSNKSFNQFQFINPVHKTSVN